MVWFGISRKLSQMWIRAEVVNLGGDFRTTVGLWDGEGKKAVKVQMVPNFQLQIFRFYAGVKAIHIR